MKTYLLRLFKEDLARKEQLISFYSEKWGKKAAYADVLRELQREKIQSLSPNQSC